MLTTVTRQVSVVGSGGEWESAAEEVGRLLAERGCTVVTGGLGEVMAAAHRGAKSAGGTTLAILPGEDRPTPTSGPTTSSSRGSDMRGTWRSPRAATP